MELPDYALFNLLGNRELNFRRWAGKLLLVPAPGFNETQRKQNSGSQTSIRIDCS